MTKFNSLFLAVALNLIVPLSASATCVNLRFYDSFEHYPVGTVDPGPWQYLSSGVTAEVSDAKPNDWWPRSGTQSLYVEGQASWARTEYVKLCSVPDVLNYEVSVFVDHTNPNVNVGFMFWDPELPNQIPFLNKIRFFPTGEKVGEIWWRGHDEMHPVVKICDFDLTVDQVYRLRAEIDYVTETADVYVFKVDTGDWCYALDVPASPFDTTYRGHPITLDQFGVGVGGLGGTGNTKVYLDDVFITPEPATILLLGLGGLALMRKRRA